MDFSLSAGERAALANVVANAKDVRQVKRAQTLLAVAADVSVSAVARNWQVARNTICNSIERFQERSGPNVSRMPSAVGGPAI
jgi:hypothetical protein